jgi:sphingomyelin phosphodiesterase acid-like 3
VNSPRLRRDDERLRVVWLSDVHLNPAYTKLLGRKCKCFNFGPYLCDTEAETAMTWPFDGVACLASSTRNPWGQFGCDAPIDLLVSAIGAAQAALPAPNAVLVTGDYVAHDSCQFPVTDPAATAVHIIGRVSGLIAAAFGAGVAHVHHPPALSTATLGNDDVVPNYAQPNVTDGALGPPLPELEATAAVLRPPLSREQRARFVRGGAVRYDDVGDGLALLALNTVVYSPEHARVSGPAGADPFGQFAWLEDQLAQLRRAQRGAVISGHIPPTVDQFTFQMEWLQPYADRYVGIIAAFHDVVGAQLFGHTHQNMLRAFPPLRRPGMQGAPLLVTAAVTPIYGNNPTWRSLEVAPRSGAVLDYSVYAADLDAASASAKALTWTERFRASERYAPYDVLSSDGLRSFAAALLVDDVLFSKYLLDRVSGAPSWKTTPDGKAYDGDRTFRVKLACGIALGFSQRSFDACVEQGGPTAPGLRKASMTVVSHY